MKDSIAKNSFILVYLRKVGEYKTEVLTPLKHLKRGFIPILPIRWSSIEPSLSQQNIKHNQLGLGRI